MNKFLILTFAFLSNLVVFADCDEFPENLKKCSAYSCTYKHPMGAMMGNPNLMMKKSIVGLENGKCRVNEQMPNNGKMVCLFDKQSRDDVANYWETVMVAKSVKSRGNGSKVSTRVNGKKVKDPLMAALNNGTCKVSGYGETSKKPRGCAKKGVKMKIGGKYVDLPECPK